MCVGGVFIVFYCPTCVWEILLHILLCFYHSKKFLVLSNSFKMTHTLKRFESAFSNGASQRQCTETGEFTFEKSGSDRNDSNSNRFDVCVKNKHFVCGKMQSEKCYKILSRT